MSKTETGFFDFHKLVVTMLIVFYKTEKTKIIQKRNYITFSKQLLAIELDKKFPK